MNNQTYARVRARRNGLILALCASLALAIAFGAMGMDDAQYARYEASQSYK